MAIDGVLWSLRLRMCLLHPNCLGQFGFTHVGSGSSPFRTITHGVFPPYWVMVTLYSLMSLLIFCDAKEKMLSVQQSSVFPLCHPTFQGFWQTPPFRVYGMQTAPTNTMYVMLRSSTRVTVCIDAVFPAATGLSPSSDCGRDSEKHIVLFGCKYAITLDVLPTPHRCVELTDQTDEMLRVVLST